MKTKRTIPASAVAWACALVLTLLTASGAASTERTIGAEDGGIAAGSGECVPAWHPFTSGGQTGANSDVLVVTVWNGELIASGGFTTAGGQTVNGIARWDGSTWHPFISGGQAGMGGGSQTVDALTVWNGDLVAGGSFTTAGGQTVNNIARWDGTAWHPFTSGGQIGVNNPVRALAVWNGNLVASGQFLAAGGQTVNRIARWDGSAWHPFTSGGQTGVNSSVDSLTVWTSDLVAGGGFTTAGGQTVNRIARWDGTAWHPFTSGGEIGVNALVSDLTVYNGHLVAGGQFWTAGGQTVNRIARWDGSTWHPFVSGGQTGVGVNFNEVSALTLWNGNLVAGGNFLTAGGQTVNRIARWDGSAWHPFTVPGFAPGMDFPVWALSVWNTDLVAGGAFLTVGGELVRHIARWDACVVEPNCPGELNNSGAVDVQDLLMLLGAWGPCGKGDCPADLNNSGTVDVQDLLILLGAWGPCPE